MIPSRMRGPAVITAVLAAAAVLFIFRIQREMIDFSVNYRAGDRLLHGESLYRTTDEHFQYKYSPFCAIVYAPLAVLPPVAAKAVWYALVIAALASLVILTSSLMRVSGSRRPVFAAGFASLILAKFFFRELQLGQINAIVAALLLGTAFLLARHDIDPSLRRSSSAGLLWGLAMALKPYAVIFLPYLLLKRKWNALAVGLVVLAATFFAPAAFYGSAGNLLVHQEWIATLSASTPTLLDSQDNVSLLAFFVKTTGQPLFSQALYAGAVIILAIFVLVFIRAGRGLPHPLVAETGLLLLLIPLVSPLGWDYTFLSAILAAAVVLDGRAALSRFWRAVLVADFALIGLSLYDVMGRRAYALFMSLSVLTVGFLILAAFLARLRWTRRA